MSEDFKVGNGLNGDGGRNLQLFQEAYLKDLGNRYASELTASGKPATPSTGPMDDEAQEEAPSTKAIRRAQILVGELPWASIRTRPDVSFSVSHLASMIMRAPERTYKLSMCREWNPADLGTKSLPGPRHWKLYDFGGTQGVTASDQVSRGRLRA